MAYTDQFNTAGSKAVVGPLGPESLQLRDAAGPLVTRRRLLFFHKEELASLINLAFPVVMAELGWMTMAVVDTAMVGRLNAVAIGAVGLGSILYGTIVLFGFGLLLSMDPLVSKAFGAGDIADCHHTLHQGIFLAFALTLPIMGLSYALPALVLRWDVNPLTAAACGPFIRVLSWSTLPLLLYACLRRYMQGRKLVRPVMAALISANLVNWLGNWALIYGHLGFRAYGIEGSAWSTVVSRIYMAGFLLLAILYNERSERSGLFHMHPRLDAERLREMLRIGVPAASQILLEVGAFAAATVIAGKLSPVALAAHQIALNCASFTYMVPLGIASATAVSVGHALGQNDHAGAVRAGWLGIGLGTACMGLGAIFFLAIPSQIMRIYTTQPQVIRTGSSLLLIAAFFQLFDGIQTVTTGALRGVSDTASAMTLNFLGYWLIGLPVGWYLCFHLRMGARGVWLGLSAAILLLAFALLAVWRSRTKSFLHAPKENIVLI